MKTIVITVRDPDASNEYTIHEGDEVGVEVIDIDLGRSFDGRPDDHDQWFDWAESVRADVAELPLLHPARAQVEAIVAELEPMTAETSAAVRKAVAYIRANDCDFLTAETVGMYAHVTTEQARRVMIDELGLSPKLVA